MKKLILLGLMSAFADCSAMDDSRRQFAGLESSLHKRLPFGANRLPSSASKVFEGEVYDHSDKLSVVCAFSDLEKNNVQIEQVQEDKESPIFLSIQQGVTNLSNLKNTLGEAYSRLKFVSIPNSVEELCERCFFSCQSLSRITFGEASSLKLIGKEAFYDGGLCEIQIPDCVEELGDECFYGCESLSRVTFGEASSLKLIGKKAFCNSGLREIHIPNGVEKLCERCFFSCQSLSRVTFGEASSLKLIGKEAFLLSHLREIHIPDCVEELCVCCFASCRLLSRVTFGEKPCLKRIGKRAFIFSDFIFCAFFCTFREIRIPDGVKELCESCFDGCKLLSRVTFGEKPCLKRIGVKAFCNSGIREIHIPDSVEELGVECFYVCKSLSCVTFGEASSLKIVGKGAFRESGLCEVYAPKNVQELIEQALAGTKLDGKAIFSDPQ